MATPGELCRLTAELLGLEPNATANAWRALREDAQVTSGGRGRSAALCVSADAANLLIAVLGKLPLRSYLKSWERFSALPCAYRSSTIARGVSVTTEFAQLLSDRHSLKAGLTALLSAATSGWLEDFSRKKSGAQESFSFREVLVTFVKPMPFVSIQIGDDEGRIALHFVYSDVADPSQPVDRIQPFDEESEWPQKLPPGAGDLRMDLKISARTIFALGKALRTGRNHQ